MKTKTCFKCKETKPISDFYKHPRMGDGHLGKCKECTKRDVRLHRAENDSVREYDRRRYYETPGRKDRTALTSAQWNNDNPDGYRAHYEVHNAIRSGKLKRMPCEICGDPEVHAHHDDYSKPLDVKWLCVRHHALLHADAKRL